jgi:hypothetical protein
MKPVDKYIFLFFGIAFWILGTVWYELRGPRVFESTSHRYWINFVITPLATTAICILIMTWRAVPAAAWGSAALLIAIPACSAKPCCSRASPRSCRACARKAQAAMGLSSSRPTRFS